MIILFQTFFVVVIVVLVGCKLFYINQYQDLIPCSFCIYVKFEFYFLCIFYSWRNFHFNVFINLSIIAYSGCLKNDKGTLKFNILQKVTHIKNILVRGLCIISGVFLLWFSVLVRISNNRWGWEKYVKYNNLTIHTAAVYVLCIRYDH